MKNAGKVVLSLLLVSSVSAGASCLIASSILAKADTSGSPFKGQEAHLVAAKTPSGIETDFTVAAERSVNAVVHIASKTMKSAGQPEMNDMFDYLFGFRGQVQPQQPQPQVGYGSGVIISTDGYIVTNNHVVDGADEINVTLNDRTSYSAKVIGTDPNTDVALIKVDAKDLPVISFGNSDNLKIGEWVLAVGNPMNLTSTVTAGIVSAKARNLGLIANENRSNPFQNQRNSNATSMSIESFIQTDAAVNPGNSGGALVNLKGELVGINTAIMSPTGSFTGYSFAVPVNIVAKVVADMKQFGSVQRAMLGVTIKDIGSELAKEKNISVQEGVYVESVADRSGAKEAGLEPGDIIKQINDVKVKSTAELQEHVGLQRPGDVVELQIKRGDKNVTKKVTLKNLQGGTTAVKASDLTALGAAFREINDADKKRLNLSYGVEVTGITEGKFKEAGVRKGFIILKINDMRIESVANLEDVVKDIQKNANFDERGMFVVGMYPNGKVTYYAMDLGD